MAKTTEKPFRVGVYRSVEEAARAVHGLLAAGVSKDQIAVICPDKDKSAFSGVPMPGPATSHTAEDIVAGGAVGATLGGLALAAATVAGGGLGLLAAGTVLVGGGALSGAFVGAMSTRGFEKEIANYYEQAVEEGNILVAAEVHGAGSAEKLALAERILAEAGAVPVSLVEG